MRKSRITRATAVGLLIASCAFVPAMTPAGATTPTYWRIVPSASFPDLASSTVSCATSTMCMAVQGANGVRPSLASSWNGSTWTSPVTVAGSHFGGFARDVSCPSTTFCMAVGGSVNNPATESWNGTMWTDRPTPGGGFADLRAVACSSTTFCMAVGTDANGMLAVTWNGASWTQVASPGALLVSVSCPTSSSCKGIGVTNSGSAIESWNGTAWSQTASPIQTVAAVSCTTTASCMAVGGSSAMSWNGTSWTAVATPTRGAHLNLSGVSCPAASSCIAVGWDNNQYGDYRTLVESWDGASWTIVPSPNSGYNGDLRDVSCVSPTACMVVGALFLVSDPANPPPGPPSPPLVSVAPQNGAAMVWLKPNDDGASPVTTYSASCTSSNGGVSRSAHRGHWPIPVMGLTNLKTYRCTARATNALGTSSPSTASAAFVPAPPPGPPSIGRALSGDAKVTVHWKPAPTNGTPITGYTVTVRATGHADIVKSFGPAARTVAIALANGCRCALTVQAKNRIGFGPSSSKRVVVVGSPLAPTAVVATPGTRRATLQWKASGSNGSPITAYVVTPYKAGVAQPTRVFHSTATTQILTGLASGAAYTFRVAAGNARGVGAQSAASEAVTPT